MKVLIMGPQGAGKTRMAERLLGPNTKVFDELDHVPNMEGEDDYILITNARDVAEKIISAIPGLEVIILGGLSD